MTCKKLLMLILAFALVFCFAACGDKDNAKTSDEPMFGEWREQRDDGFATTYQFNGDGTGYILVLDLANPITYTYDDAKIYMEIHVDTPPMQRVYDYKIEGNKITLGYTTDSGEYAETVCYKV